jgi:hypothetical protein
MRLVPHAKDAAKEIVTAYIQSLRPAQSQAEVEPNRARSHPHRIVDRHPKTKQATPKNLSVPFQTKRKKTTLIRSLPQFLPQVQGETPPIPLL